MTMTIDKAHAYRQRWRDLEREAKDLDWRKSVWARELRSEYPATEDGQAAFIEWLRREVGFDGFKCNEMITRASAAAIVKDEKTFKRLGGAKATKWLLKLPRDQVVPVIESAKAQSKNIQQVIRERGLSDRKPSEPPDVVLFAEFIATRRDAPPALRDRAQKYVRAKALRVAA